MAAMPLQDRLTVTELDEVNRFRENIEQAFVFNADVAGCNTAIGGQ